MQDQLPPGHEYKEFVVPRFQDVIFKYSKDEVTAKIHANSKNTNMSRAFKKDVLIPIEEAPKTMIDKAGDKEFTYIDPRTNKKKFRVEKIRRIVKCKDVQIEEDDIEEDDIVDFGELGLKDSEKIGAGVSINTSTSVQRITVDTAKKFKEKLDKEDAVEGESKKLKIKKKKHTK